MAKTIPALLAVLALSSTASYAETLLLDSIEMDAQTASMRPKAGMTMPAVESTYGAPAERHPTVGNPPITRWDYAGFSVYFEGERVIHAVARR